MDTMIVMYNLADSQSEAAFETWLREVDMPNYAKLSSMHNPTYFRAGAMLGTDKPAPYQYTVVIEMDGAEAVEAEIAKWVQSSTV